jgi:hypothetical protein
VAFPRVIGGRVAMGDGEGVEMVMVEVLMYTTMVHVGHIEAQVVGLDVALVVEV